MAKSAPKSKPTARGAAAHRSTARRVRATKVGFYQNARRRVGDVFVLEKESDFSEKWMEPVDATTPERRTSSRDAQATGRPTRSTLGGVPVEESPTGAANPIGDDE